jgi:hypothetical protein
MTPGGKREGAGRKPRLEREGKPPKALLGCRVEQSSFDFIQEQKDQSGLSPGEIVDIAIETLKEHPEKHPPIKQPDESGQDNPKA